MHRSTSPRSTRLLVALALTTTSLLGCTAPAAPSNRPAPGMTASAAPPATPPPIRALVLAPQGRESLLFDAELEVLQPLFLSALVAQHEKPVSPLDRKEMEALEALRSAQRLSATGPTCKQMPMLERVALATYPDLVSAQLLVSCTQRCTASLVLYGSQLPFTRVGNGERMLELTREVADPELLGSYADAVRALAAPAVVGSPRELGTTTPPETSARTQIRSALLGPRWSDGLIALSSNVFCWDGSDRALFELSATGQVERCESRDNSAAERHCDLCSALRSAPQTPGSAGRRALITTFSKERRSTGGRLGDGSFFSRYRAQRHAWLTSEAWLAQDDRDALARINEAVAGCVPPRRYATPADDGPVPVEAQLLVTQSADGGVASVSFSDQLGLRAEEQSCFEAKLREVGFPCPLGQKTLTLKLRGQRTIAFSQDRPR